MGDVKQITKGYCKAPISNSTFKFYQNVQILNAYLRIKTIKTLILKNILSNL